MKDRSLTKQFMTIGVGTFISIIISVLTTPIITRLVSPVQYGQLSIFRMYSDIALMVFCLGLDQALVRYYYRMNNIEYKKDLIAKSFKLPIIVALMTGLIIYTLIFFRIINVKFSNVIIVILFINITVQIINRFSMLVIRLEYHTKLFSFLNIIHKILYVSIALLFIISTDYNDFYLLALALMLSHAITSFIGILFEKKLWIYKNNKKNDLKINNYELFKYGFPFILSMGVTTLFQSVDKISLNYYGDYSEVGIYSSAMSIVSIFAIIQSTFNTIWSPLAIKNYEEKKNNKQFLKVGNEIITVIMLFIGIFLILFKDIFVILLGNEYRDAAYIIPFLIFNPIMYTISETTVLGIVYKNKSTMHLWIALLSLLTNIVGNIILVPIFGGRGAAISTGISYIVFFTARTLVSNRYYYVNYNLKKIYIMTALIAVYATYNTFIKFNAFTLIGAAICFLVLITLYKKVLKTMLKFTLRKFKIYTT